MAEPRPKKPEPLPGHEISPNNILSRRLRTRTTPSAPSTPAPQVPSAPVVHPASLIPSTSTHASTTRPPGTAPPTTLAQCARFCYHYLYTILSILVVLSVAGITVLWTSGPAPVPPPAPPNLSACPSPTTTIVTGICGTASGIKAGKEQFCRQTLKCRLVVIANTAQPIWTSIGTEQIVEVVGKKTDVVEEPTTRSAVLDD